MKDCAELSGMQSPKHPHVFIFPEKRANPVKKVKAIMSNKSNQFTILICQPTITATPEMISKTLSEYAKKSV